MKRIIATIIATLSINAFAQMPPLALPPSFNAEPKKSEDYNLNFQNVSIANLMTIIFSEINQKSFVLSTKVLQDERVISFRFDKKKNGDLYSFLALFLDNLGYSLNKQNGIYFIDEKRQKNAQDFDYYVYSPKFRTANYLLDNLRPYFAENFTTSFSQIPAQDGQKINSEELSSTNPLNNVDKSKEFLSFKYDNEKIKSKILNLIEQFDKPEPNLIVKSYIYEVQYTDKDGSAMGLILNLFNDKLKVSIGSQNPLDNFVKFSTNTLSLFLSNVSTNSNIKLISNPVLRIKNNKDSILTVGNSVPTLGNVSYTGQGNPIQNIEYKDTGLVLKINPIITDKSISMNLTQEISEAILTQTGINNTPTLTKRNLQTTFSTSKNEVVMLAGLTQSKDVKGENVQVLFPFFKQKNSEISKTDIVIFLEVLDTTTN